jgi:hypothetical protein
MLLACAIYGFLRLGFVARALGFLRLASPPALGKRTKNHASGLRPSRSLRLASAPKTCEATPRGHPAPRAPRWVRSAPPDPRQEMPAQDKCTWSCPICTFSRRHKPQAVVKHQALFAERGLGKPARVSPIGGAGAKRPANNPKCVCMERGQSAPQRQAGKCARTSNQGRGAKRLAKISPMNNLTGNYCYAILVKEFRQG